MDADGDLDFSWVSETRAGILANYARCPHEKEVARRLGATGHPLTVEVNGLRHFSALPIEIYTMTLTFPILPYFCKRIK